MPDSPRVVAELGRPETADETAARKAESSRVYRSSQNTRNLVAALLATLTVVAVIIFAVPRGSMPEQAPIDVVAVAQGIESTQNTPVIAPVLSDYWVVNRAGIEEVDGVRTWTIIMAPADENRRGFLRITQGFEADEGWTSRVLAGASPSGSVTVDSVRWERYEVDPARVANISVALETQVGQDTVLIYGTATDAELDEIAGSVSEQILDIREESQ